MSEKEVLREAHVLHGNFRLTEEKESNSVVGPLEADQVTVPRQPYGLPQTVTTSDGSDTRTKRVGRWERWHRGAAVIRVL